MLLPGICSLILYRRPGHPTHPNPDGRTGNGNRHRNPDHHPDHRRAFTDSQYPDGNHHPNANGQLNCHRNANIHPITDAFPAADQHVYAHQPAADGNLYTDQHPGHPNPDLYAHQHERPGYGHFYRHCNHVAAYANLYANTNPKQHPGTLTRNG